MSDIQKLSDEDREGLKMFVLMFEHFQPWIKDPIHVEYHEKRDELFGRANSIETISTFVHWFDGTVTPASSPTVPAEPT